MEQKLEKLFSNVLVTWLNLKSLSEMPGVTEPDRTSFLYAALQLEHCLKDAGFELDMRDFQKELKDIVA